MPGPYWAALRGCFSRRSIPDRVTDAVMKGIGLCVIYIGVSGALEEKTITS